jgi:hypothetical protein
VMFPFGTRGCQNCSAVITISTLICTSFIISLTKLYSGGNVYFIFTDHLLLCFSRFNSVMFCICRNPVHGMAH